MAEKELSVEEKRNIGEAYYARLSDGVIEHFLEEVWHVLFYSSSQRQYPKDPTRALNAIDMLIAKAEKRFGHVEPAPISTFLYNRDMTNADGVVRNEFERSNLDKSPDNHPEFAAREAKIFALIASRRYSSGDEISCYRQGKGYYKDFGDSGAFYDYEFIGARSSFPTTKVTLQDIEENIDYDLCNLGGIGINAIIPFRCSGEYKRDVSDLLEKMVAKDNVRKVRKEGINALPKEMREQLENSRSR